MAIPSFRAVGTPVYSANSVASTTNLAPVKNASTVNGDLLVLITASRSRTATVSTPTGWSLVSGFPKASATTSGGKIYAFVRTADSGANDAPTVTWSSLTTGTSGDSCSAVILSFQDATTTADGTPPSANDASSTTAIVIPAHTTSLAQSLVIGAAIRINDTAHTFTVSAPYTERHDGHTTSGTGHGMIVASRVLNPAGTSTSVTVTPSSTTSSRALAVSFGLKAAPTYVTLNQATDTETAQAITVGTGSSQVVSLLQASDSETAQAITRRKVKTIGQPSDAEVAQAITRRKVKTIGQASDSETAQAITLRREVALGQASDAEVAQPLTPRRLVGLALVSDNETAQPLTPAKSATLALVSDNETAQSFAVRKARTLGLATETNTALKITKVASTLYPDPADVRAGVVYGPGGIYTGTMQGGSTNLIFARRR